MAFEVLENIRSGPANEPDWESGAKVTARVLGRKDKASGETRMTRYVQITLGRKLAAAMSLTQETHNLVLQFGKGEDHGFLGISVDNSTGTFGTKRDAQRRYRLTMSEATCSGKLLTEFEPLFVEKADILCIANDKPVFAVLDVRKLLVASS